MRSLPSELARQLYVAAELGHRGGVAECLAKGADPNTPQGAWTPLMRAAFNGHAAAVSALLAGGAKPDAAGQGGQRALHFAVQKGHCHAAQALLDGGAEPTARAGDGATPLHAAAASGHSKAAALLLAAAPEAALMHDASGMTPLAAALRSRRISVAHRLLSAAPLPPAAEVLSLLAQAGAAAMPLYVLLISRAPLTAAEWDQVPRAWAGLGAALPAVLARSVGEAALLVRRLPAAARERLRLATVYLHRAQRGLPQLPQPLLWRVAAFTAVP